MSAEAVQTERLTLRRPSREDLDALFAISSDARVWRHYPSQRPTAAWQTLGMIERLLEGWQSVGLSLWTVRETETARVIGYGGCLPAPVYWNLGYRLTPAAQGRGYATELSAEALRRARAADPRRPIVARMVEHNAASARVAVKLGMTLAHRAYDTGNPDPEAVRLVYADRTLTAAQLTTILG